MIKDFWEDPYAVMLITRPRRFGKTLNLSMLRYFFEKGEASTQSLFSELLIENHPEIMEHQGQYPVIYLTFKDLKILTFEKGFEGIRGVIGDEFQRHEALLKNLEGEDKNTFEILCRGEATQTMVERSLKLLCQWLYEATGEKPLIFLDEYDVPVHSIYLKEDYETFITFLRNFLSTGLKDNSFLGRALLTGILRVSKESIFTGLNHFGIYGILQDRFSSYFGLTEAEVDQLIIDFEVKEHLEDIKTWYNGYLFGKQRLLYNPWSVFNYVTRPEEGLVSYWINTSGNDLIRDLILRGVPQVQEGVEDLLSGGTITTPLQEHTVLRDLDSSVETVWSLFVFSGYLKPVSYELNEGGGRGDYHLAIPNREVKEFFRHTVQAWFQQQLGSSNLNAMLKALAGGDYDNFCNYLRDFVRSILSYYDVCYNEPERVYHAFVLGLLIQLQSQYLIRSNRESGYGRYDLILIPKDKRKNGIVIEFKKLISENQETTEKALQSALKQIEDKHYADELRQQGIKKVDGLAIVIDQKKLWMKSKEILESPKK